VMRRWRLVGDLAWDECTAAGCGSPPTLEAFAVIVSASPTDPLKGPLQ
jgi:hypothetical protein